MMLNDDWVGNPPLQRASARKWRVIEFWVWSSNDGYFPFSNKKMETIDHHDFQKTVFNDKRVFGWNESSRNVLSSRNSRHSFNINLKKQA